MTITNNSPTARQFKMDLLDPFDGAEHADGDDFLQSISDDEDLMLNFNSSGNPHPGRNVGGDTTNAMNDFDARPCHSEPLGSTTALGGFETVGPESPSNHSNSKRDGNAYGRSTNQSSHRSCASEPFMLDSELYQQLSATVNNSVNDNNNHNDKIIGNSNINPENDMMIGTTIKMPLPPLEPLEFAPQRSGRSKRVANSRRRRISRSNSSDGIMNMSYAEEPLFGGVNNNIQSRVNNFGMTQQEFLRSNLSTPAPRDAEARAVSDVASACSAPAELLGLVGFLDVDDTKQSGEGVRGGEEGGRCSAPAVSDAMDIQKEFGMSLSTLLSDDYENTGNSNGINAGAKKIQPQRLQPEQPHKQHEAFARSLNNLKSDSSGTGKQPQRRNTLDRLSLMLSSLGDIDDAAIPTTIEPFQHQKVGDLNKNMSCGCLRMLPSHDKGNNMPIKRRKSLPMPDTTELWSDAPNTSTVPKNNSVWCEQQQNTNISMPHNDVMPNRGNAAPNQATDMTHSNIVPTQAIDMTSLIAEAQEAFETINCLKELMVGPATASMGVQANVYQTTAPLMAGAVMRAGAGGQQLSPWQQQGHQPQIEAQQNKLNQFQAQQMQPNQSQPFPDFLMKQKILNELLNEDNQMDPSSFATKQRSALLPQFDTSKEKLVPPSKFNISPITPKAATPVIVPQIPLPEQFDPELLKLDQGKVMYDLQTAMGHTTDTQKLLQEWDRANGLPKSHSQTMVNSSRSRKQLTDGVILNKWNGAPLLNFAKEKKGVGALRSKMPYDIGRRQQEHR